VLFGFSTWALEDAVMVEFDPLGHIPNASLHVEALQKMSESPQYPYSEQHWPNLLPLHVKLSHCQQRL
jgi:hypothetical protein